MRSLIDNFNANMKKIFHPMKYLLVDEIMLAWVGLCALFIAFGIPHLTKITRKPQGVGAEMKAVACGDSGMLLGFDIQEGTERNSQKNIAEYGFSSHGALTWCLQNHYCGQRLRLSEAPCRLVDPLWYGYDGCCRDRFCRFPKEIAE